MKPDTLQLVNPTDRSILYKRLVKFYVAESTAGIQSTQAVLLLLILGRLRATLEINDMDLPGLRLHEISCKRDDISSVSVSGNWRINFLFENGDDQIVNYEDYH